MPLPTPSDNETQSGFISRCMSSIKDEFKGEQAQAVCFNQWRKKESVTSKYLLEFSQPIFEFREQNDDFVITGTAINETTTHNNHKYIAEELEKASNGLVGKPLLVDHDNRVESIKGRVVGSHFDQKTKSIQFEAKIMDKGIKEMIKDGRLTNVSIGAFAKELDKDSSGSLVAKGLDIVELSLVAVPADPNASFAMAMDTGYKVKEFLKEADYECPDCGKMFDSKKEMQKHKEEKHSMDKESLSTEILGEKETNERRSKMETEKLESELKEQLRVLTEERNSLREEKRQTLISRYKNLSREKNVKEKDVSKISEESIGLLIEQLESFEMPKAEKGFRSVVEMPKHEENFVVETDIYGKAKGLFKMPDVDKIRRLHSDHTFGRTWQ